MKLAAVKLSFEWIPQFSELAGRAAGWQTVNFTALGSLDPEREEGDVPVALTSQLTDAVRPTHWILIDSEWKY